MSTAKQRHRRRRRAQKQTCYWPSRDHTLPCSGSVTYYEAWKRLDDRNAALVAELIDGATAAELCRET
jgi:hypothetical protein